MLISLSWISWMWRI